ncbi:MAG: NIPSNAP family protein [Planctomycetota bacterium]|nr:NIPSNAP family protein [Planctomycetota bacterium]
MTTWFNKRPRAFKNMFPVGSRYFSRDLPGSVLCFWLACLLNGALADDPGGPNGWRQSYVAGYVDQKGQHAGGSEIMHLVAHQGKLYAANGYWMDAHWVIPTEQQKQSAQVLRLDGPGLKWQVDLDLGKSNGLGLRYMKGNILRSITLTLDPDGKPMERPVSLLLMAAGAVLEGGGAVSCWTRDEKENRWQHELVRHGSSAGGVRWVPRDIEVYRDKVTGKERIFLLLGNPGMIAGSYAPELPSKIRWDRHLEFPFLDRGKLRTRPLGIATANGSLFLSEGSSIYRRQDGHRPRYLEILNLQEDTDTDIGGIRGLTTISHPSGAGDSLLFLWAPGGKSRGEIMRLDPKPDGGFALVKEISLADLASRKLGAEVVYSLGAHNMMYPVVHPRTGKRVHLVGFQTNLRGKNESKWAGTQLYGGAQYAIRDKQGDYRLAEVNNRYSKGKPPLVTPRAFSVSPFGDGKIYIGGHDASNRVSDNMAWIFETSLQVALGLTAGSDAPEQVANKIRLPRVEQGPIFELRIYQAAEGRFQDLVNRFANHTDRLFRKHGMEPVAYWRAEKGSVVQNRKLVYLLRHPSRYEAFCNWTRFHNDREWKRALERPEYRGLLSQRPSSHFLEIDSPVLAKITQSPSDSAVLELKTFWIDPSELQTLDSALENTKWMKKSGIRSLGACRPFDRPGTGTTVCRFFRHSDQERVKDNWLLFAGLAGWNNQREPSKNKGPGTFARSAHNRSESILLRRINFDPREYGSADDDSIGRGTGSDCRP